MLKPIIRKILVFKETTVILANPDREGCMGRLKFFYIMYVTLIRTSQRMHCSSIRGITQLKLFRKIISVCSKHHTEYVKNYGSTQRIKSYSA
jgi:hypothetical protein